MSLLTLLTLAGCATTPYVAGSADSYFASRQLADQTEIQIERGKPHRGVDTFGWIWGIPGKILLFDRRVENHRIGETTEAEIAAYLQDNDLTTVKVRLNQYRPLDDWRRLAANDSVGAGWRYTFGAVTVLGETVFPGRLFGSDHFNPYTNTVHLYSDVPALALHEAGHSKDYAGRKWKGTYAAIYNLPFVPLYQEAIATNDALSYVKSTGDPADLQDAYEILYPAYGTYVGSAISGSVPYGYFVGLMGGHLAGQWKSRDLGQISDTAQKTFVHPRQSLERLPSEE
jgi:hypothetical protein